MTQEERRALEQKIEKGVSSIRDSSDIYVRTVNNLVSEYSEDLDIFADKMDQIVKSIRDGTITKYSELGLELRCIILAQAMYRASEGLSILGGRSDLARMDREEAFNKAYKLAKDGTIPDKKAEAEAQILTEKMIEGLMQRAYSALAAKVKAGNRVLEALKKVLTSRMIAQEVFRKEFSSNDEIASDIDDNGDLGDESDE